MQQLIITDNIAFDNKVYVTAEGEGIFNGRQHSYTQIEEFDSMEEAQQFVDEDTRQQLRNQLLSNILATLPDASHRLADTSFYNTIYPLVRQLATCYYDLRSKKAPMPRLGDELRHVKLSFLLFLHYYRDIYFVCS